MHKMASLEDIYEKYEKASLAKHSKAGRQLSINNAGIRKTVKTLLQKRQKVLVSAIVDYLVDHKLQGQKSKDTRTKVRIRVISAVGTQNSGLTLQKDKDGRVWVISK